MPLIVNNTTIKKFQVVKNGVTTELNLFNYNGTYVYVKEFTYSTGSSYDRPNYWGFRCRRGSSPYANASIGQINDGDTIYYGDTIYFVVNDDLEEIGFTLTPAYTESNQLTVTSDITGSDYITVNKARGRVWLTGWGEGDPTAITSVCVKVDNGNWVQYDNLPYDDVSVTVQETVYFDSLVQIYDIVNTGYTAQYTQSSPKQINMERDYQSISDGIYVYTYQAKPATCSFQFVKNTGVDKIYYRNSTSGSWTELSSTTTVNFNFGSTVQWYATAATGYNRNDSYTSSSNYQTINVSVKQTISPAATIKTYNVSITKGTGVDRIYYKTSSSGSYSYTTSNLSLTLNHGTYFAWYATPATGYNVTSSYTSSNPYTNSGVTSALSFSATASLKTYTLTITKNTGVATIYYKVNGASSWSSTTSSKTVSVNYGSNIYWYATASSGYTRDDSYTSSSSYATISNVTSDKTISPTATSNTITYTIYVAAIDTSVIAPYYICSDGEDYDMMVAPGGLGNHVIKEFTVQVQRKRTLKEVYLSQSAIQQKLPGSYVYTGGTITFTANPDNPSLYVGVYVYDDDH